MAKLLGPLFSEQATGLAFGSLEFIHSSGLSIVRRKRKSTYRQYPSTSLQRSKFRVVANAWHSLTPAEKAAWKKKTPSDLTPYQFWIKENINQERLVLGVIVIGIDVVNQGGYPYTVSPDSYIEFFPSDVDSIPVYEDFRDPVKAFMLNEYRGLLLNLESWLLDHKANIEEG